MSVLSEIVTVINGLEHTHTASVAAGKPPLAGKVIRFTLSSSLTVDFALVGGQLSTINWGASDSTGEHESSSIFFVGDMRGKSTQEMAAEIISLVESHEVAVRLIETQPEILGIAKPYPAQMERSPKNSSLVGWVVALLIGVLLAAFGTFGGPITQNRNDVRPSSPVNTVAPSSPTVVIPSEVPQVPTGYRVRCADGWISNSGGKQGACSHHGGIAD